MPQPVQVTVFIIGTIVIIIAAYYVTYFIGMKSTGASRGRNRNINMVDRFAISKDKSFCLVEIAGKIYVVGVTNQGMTLLDTLDAEEFAEAAAERGSAPAWHSVPGGRQVDGLTRKLASFLAGMMGKNRGADGGADGSGAGPGAGARKNAPGKDSGNSKDKNEGGAGPGGASFEDNLNYAHARSKASEKKASGQPDREKPERMDDPEGEQ